ncbi:MAG TPA: tetratricopeptide repeat protein, partial [Tenuifilaceae bacterium]|nr:tetratricopeptide repeat protein [Tenuifilaceae bacterium]
MSRYFSYILLVIVSLIQFTFVFSQSTSISQEKFPQLNEEIKLAKQFAAEQDFNQAAFYYGKVANTYWQNDMLQQAAEHFQNALEMSEKLGNNNAVYILSTNLGLIFTDTEEYDKALESFSQAAAVAAKLGRKADVASSYINQANIYYEKGNYSNALNALNTANAIAQELNEPKLLRNIYSVFTKVYDKQGNIEESAKYFNLFSAITKKIQQDEFRVKEEAA